MPMIKRELVADAIRSIIKKDHDYLDVVWGIKEFNDKFEVEPNPELYANLIAEEVNEWWEELFLNGYTANLLKETIDIVYVLEGFLAAAVDEYVELPMLTLERLHVALQTISEAVAPISSILYVQSTLMEGFKEVQRSNLSKLGDDGKPIRREDKKILKGPNYSPANMDRFVFTRKEFIKYNKI